MPTQRGYKQRYSTNEIQATSSGRKGQAAQTSVNGRYYGSRQAQSKDVGGGVGRGGQNISRSKYYYDRRVGAYRMYAENPEMRQQVAQAVGRRGSLGLTMG